MHNMNKQHKKRKLTIRDKLKLMKEIECRNEQRRKEFKGKNVAKRKD